MSKIKPWLSAIRLRTLPLSVSGIILGACFAYYNGFFNIYILILAILTTISFQILSNLANDYGDGVKGTDDKDRIGPERAIQSGAISPDQMFDAIKLNIFISILCALALIYTSFGTGNFLYALLFFLLGGFAIYSALTYTIGDSAYGYKGFGDVFVFVFFGLVSCIGSYILFGKQIDHVLFLPAISLGLLSVGVLNLNNMRDIDSDKRSGKNTLAVKLGKRRAKNYHIFIIGSAIILSFIFSILYYTSVWNFLFYISYIPLLLHLKKVIATKSPEGYDPQLKVLALTTFLFSVLLGVGYII